MRQVSLDELEATLTGMANGTHDVHVKGRDMVFGEDGTMTVRGKKYTWNDWSFSQFCAKLKLPTEFLRRCPNGTGPSGKKGIVDFWKEQADSKNFFLRVKDAATKDSETGAEGYVRAVLTDRYSILDNLDLLNLMKPFIRSHDLSLQIGHVTDKSYHMRLLFPKEIPIGDPDGGGGGDVHQVGIHITNSEVGATNLGGDFLLYRQVCMNGLMAVFNNEPLFSQRHINIDTHELRMSVKSALEMVTERQDEVIGRAERAMGQTVVNPHRELKRVLKNGRASDDFIEMAIEAYDAAPNPTRFGVTQAMTQAAQRLQMDARVLIENVAGSYLMAA